MLYEDRNEMRQTQNTRQVKHRQNEGDPKAFDFLMAAVDNDEPCEQRGHIVIG